MTGLEALELLKQGKRVRKCAWSKKEYIYLDKRTRVVDENNETIHTANEIQYYLNDENWEEYNIKVVDKWLNPTYYDYGGFSCECPFCHKITQTTKPPEFPNLIYYCMYCGEKNIIKE